VLTIGDQPDDEIVTYAQGRTDFIRKLRDLYTEDVGPHHVVHLHSSMAGGLGRVLLPAANRRRHPFRVIYSPHGYSFLREDVPRLTARAFRLTETMLARRVDGVGVVGQHERACALSLGVRDVTVIPHAARYLMGQDPDEQPAPKSPRFTVVGVGRLTPAKDPAQFAEIAAALPEVDFVWVGSGDETMAEELRNAGVRVTGWQQPDQVKAELRQSSVLLVTSRWEGFPYSIVEALQERRPVVYRSIPSLDSEFGATGYRHPSEAVSSLRQLSETHGRDALLRRQLQAIAVPGPQGEALSSLYRPNGVPAHAS
jgi:glycosyltransferase involved in cell wall biosynthesis